MHCSSYKGVTFIELIVVISIFTVISSVVLFNFSDFTANVNFQNTIADIALQLKQSQNDAINGASPRLNSINGNAQVPPNYPNTSDWIPSYGMYFNTTYPQSFMYFFDDNSSSIPGDYVPADTLASATPFASCGVGNSECLSVLTLTTKDTLSGICEGVGASLNCSKWHELSVVFKRPFPDATLMLRLGSNSIWQPATGANGPIYLQIQSGGTVPEYHYILVTPLGQISPNVTP